MKKMSLEEKLSLKPRVGFLCDIVDQLIAAEDDETTVALVSLLRKRMQAIESELGAPRKHAAPAPADQDEEEEP